MGQTVCLQFMFFLNSPSLANWTHSLKPSGFPRLTILRAFIFAVNFRCHYSTYSSAECWKVEDGQNEKYGKSIPRLTSQAQNHMSGRNEA